MFKWDQSIADQYKPDNSNICSCGNDLVHPKIQDSLCAACELEGWLEELDGPSSEYAPEEIEPWTAIIAEEAVIQ